MKRPILFLLIVRCLMASCFGQTIQEKKESFYRQEGELSQETRQQLASVNELLSEKKLQLKDLHLKAAELYHSQADISEFQLLLEEMNAIKEEIFEIEEMWRDETATALQTESYALWHQPDTSLLQLVMDYGAQEYVYLVPPEIGAIRLSVNSNLPIPRESWAECLELILEGQGVGIRTLNPYLRELYFLRHDLTGLKCITSDPRELDVLPSHARICFVFSPECADPRSVLQFMQRFSNPMTTSIHIISGEIFIVSHVEAIRELIKLHDFVKTGSRGQDYQLVKLSKLDAKEVEMILNSSFHYNTQTGGKKSMHDDEESTLLVLPLTSLQQSLFLLGTRDEVTKALKLIRDIESQVEDPLEKTVFWYTVKHSEAEELAQVLAKVYDLLTGVSIKNGKAESARISKIAEEAKSSLVVKPTHIEPDMGHTSHKTSDGQNNFIVDAKTGSIIMVVEQEALPKIKELLKRLDVPKKMVQIEVLLFEKKISNQSKFGLNLLRLGSGAKPENSNKTGVSWNLVDSGILNFLISRTKGSVIPAYDLAYHFLMGQEDVQINASPSVTTVNQTPATIAIVEEISINTGSTEEKHEKKHSFSRAQYGITIQITPTINGGEDSDNLDGNETSYVTLDTDITFDTTKKSINDRPDVTRRHVKNHVRIADGQTVIIGGLRRKNTQDNKDSIPFLGEIPGIGKLFSTTDISDDSTEMFMFITPKIICDPLEDAERIRKEDLIKRPGDIPEFLQELVDARSRERKKVFERGLTALFGKQEQCSESQKDQSEFQGR
jgi:general secretion pathway protein D